MGIDLTISRTVPYDNTQGWAYDPVKGHSIGSWNDTKRCFVWFDFELESYHAGSTSRQKNIQFRLENIAELYEVWISMEISGTVNRFQGNAGGTTSSWVTMTTGTRYFIELALYYVASNDYRLYATCWSDREKQTLLFQAYKTYTTNAPLGNWSFFIEVNDGGSQAWTGAARLNISDILVMKNAVTTYYNAYLPERTDLGFRIPELDVYRTNKFEWNGVHPS